MYFRKQCGQTLILSMFETRQLKTKLPQAKVTREHTGKFAICMVPRNKFFFISPLPSSLINYLCDLTILMS